MLNRRLHWVLYGPGGLRPGWGMLAFVLLLAAAMIMMGALWRLTAHPHLPAGLISPGIAFRSEGSVLLATLLATGAVGRLEGRAWRCYGLGDSRAGGKFLAGLAAGCALLSIEVLLLAASGHIAFDGLALQGWAIPGYALCWLVLFVVLAIAEEALYRGYLQCTLARAIGFWPAAVLLSALFGLTHLTNRGETISGALSVAIGGLLFSWLLWQSGSLWLSIGVHAAWDWSQSYLYGTADSGLLFEGHLLASHPLGNSALSGGSVGPEASLLGAAVTVLGMIGLGWLATRLWPRERG